MEKRLSKLKEEIDALLLPDRHGCSRVGRLVVMRSEVLRQALAYLRHLEELASVERVCNLEELRDLPASEKEIAADRPKAMRKSYQCSRCRIDFIWLDGVHAWFCSQPEECPACRPLCPACMRCDEAVHENCAGVGLRVKDGKHVTCMCGAVFENLADKTIPLHKPSGRETNYHLQRAEALSGYPADPEA
jgi:hypothetical protein